jgi:hypothetical protein
MGRASLSVVLLLACGRPPEPATPAIVDLPSRVVADFEGAVLTSREAYLDLFDLAAVGRYEKLLHRYDVLGRSELSEETRAAWDKETPEPFSVARERKNVGWFYGRLAQRTVGSGGCRAVDPVDEYARLLGQPFPPLSAELAAYEPLRGEVNALIERGGLVGLRCAGGHGALALVWTRTEEDRGYRLITMYDDRGAAR